MTKPTLKLDMPDLLGIEQFASSEIDADALDKVARTDVQACSKEAAQRALRDTGFCRKSIGSPIAARDLGDLLGKSSDLGVTHRLRGQLRGKLALTSGPDAKNDMPPGNGECNCAAVVGFDHRQRQIHPCGHAGGGPNAAILDMDSIAVDVDRLGSNSGVEADIGKPPLWANYGTRRQQSIRRQVVFGPRSSRRGFGTALASAPIAGLIPAGCDLGAGGAYLPFVKTTCVAFAVVTCSVHR